MPQIFMLVTEEVRNELGKEKILEVGKALIELVENNLGIRCKDDVAFTAVSTIATISEADIQVEIRYTAGRDEYGQGKPFDPTLEEQRLLAFQIKLSGRVMIPEKFSISVWCKPFYNSIFIG